MTRKSRLGFVGVLGVLGLVLAGAGLSWACTAQAKIGVQPTAAPAGRIVTVSGEAFGGDGRPVDIRWNSVNGESLATARGPNFAVGARIPADAAEGVYTIVAVYTDSLNRTFTAPTSFTVTGPAGSEGEGNAGTDSLSTSGAGGAGATGQTSRRTSGGSGRRAGPATDPGPGNDGVTGETYGSASGADSESTEGSGVVSGVSSGRESSTGTVREGRRQGTAGRTSPTSSQPAPVPAAPEALPASARPAVVTTDGVKVFGRSLGTSTPSTPVGQPIAPGLPDEGRMSGLPEPVSAGVAAQDLWSGFGPGDSGIRPSLADTSTPGGAAGRLLMLGIALAATGLVALFAGFGALAVRRRRAYSSAPHALS